MIALWGTVIAAFCAAVLAPWVKSWLDKNAEERSEDRSAKATLATITDGRMERLFAEQDRLRSAYRSDIDDLRGQLRESNGRVAALEHEVAEWRAGIRGVVGVWVAVPASLMEYIREQLPNLPQTRFPGEQPLKGDDAHPLD